MPQLNFKGKQFVQNYHFTVPYRTLKVEPKKSFPKGNASLDDNLIIHGDSLHALKALLPKYAGQIKCIYIDPPYNTGNEHWVYSDNVNSPMMKEWLGKEVGRDDLTRHDKWLCMMMPRLKLLRELLRDDGVIFVSIDDNEMHHLRFLMNEIFGEENSLTESPTALIWQRSGTTAGHFANAHEYILCYAKNKEVLPFFSLINYGDDGAIVHGALKKISKANPPSEITFPAGIEFEGADAIFEGEIGGSEKEIIKGKMVFKKGHLVNPVTIIAGWAMREQILSWLNGEETFDSKGQKIKRFFFNKEGILWYEKERGTIHPKTILPKEVGNTQTGSSEIEEIFGEKIFNFPKPSSLLKFLFSFTTKKEDIILDSFAGTGTTAHAVLALNKEDGGNRKFILVEMEDYADKITAERVRRVIKGVPTVKDENLRKGLGGSFTFVELGEPIDNEGILSGKRLPLFIDMARYVFYVATGKNINEKKIKETTGFIGETEEYEVYLLYKPDLEWLKTTALDLEKAKKIAGKKRGKKKLVFGPAKYLDEEALREFNIEFAQLPFGIYRR